LIFSLSNFFYGAAGKANFNFCEAFTEGVPRIEIARELKGWVNEEQFHGESFLFLTESLYRKRRAMSR
jgi:hypothetical protein